MFSIKHLVAFFYGMAATAINVGPGTNRRHLQERAGSTWCGAIQTTEASGDFTHVSGTWTLPQLSLRDGQTQGADLPIWVGIDGYGCQGLLQAGTWSAIDAAGSQSNSFWVEFFPAAAIFIPNWSANAGDQIKVDITATSTTTGTIDIENLTDGTKNSYPMTAPDGVTLCGTAIEWIVEWQSPGTANFPSFTMTAGGAGASSGNAAGGTLAGIIQDGVTYCSGSVDANGNVVFASS